MNNYTICHFNKFPKITQYKANDCLEASQMWYANNNYESQKLTEVKNCNGVWVSLLEDNSILYVIETGVEATKFESSFS